MNEYILVNYININVATPTFLLFFYYFFFIYSLWLLFAGKNELTNERMNKKSVREKETSKTRKKNKIIFLFNI